MQDFKPDTLCIHAGYTPKNGEPRVAPIVQSTTYVYESSKEMGDLFDLQAEGFFYTRLANPTLDAVEKKIAALEGGVGAMLTSSGQAANLMAVLNICPAGFHVVSSSAIYGGTFNLFYKTMKEMGIETTFVPPTATLEELRAAMPHTFFLVPGYGAQGGAADDVAPGFDKNGLGAIVNSSRGIMCAWQKEGVDGQDYAAAARREAIRMRDEIVGRIGQIKLP